MEIQEAKAVAQQRRTEALDFTSLVREIDAKWGHTYQDVIVEEHESFWSEED